MKLSKIHWVIIILSILIIAVVYIKSQTKGESPYGGCNCGSHGRNCNCRGAAAGTNMATVS